MGDITKPQKIRSHQIVDEKIYSFSYPDNKFQIDKIQLIEFKNQDVIIKKKTRHRHIDYGELDKFNERHEIKYEENIRRNRALHKINHECKIASSNSNKTKKSDEKSAVETETTCHSDTELEMDFADLFELSVSLCNTEDSDYSDNDTTNSEDDN